MQQIKVRQRLYRVSFKIGLVVFLAGCATQTQTPPPATRQVSGDQVGRVAANRYVTPTGQILTPAGRQVGLPGMRPQALALSPDGKLIATAGRKNALVLIDPVTAQVLQSIPVSTKEKAPAAAKKKSAARAAASGASDLSLTGLIFSPDGRRVYLSGVNGEIWMFPVSADRTVGTPTVLPLPVAQEETKTKELPAGLAVSADGKRLYVAGNLGGRLYELDAAAGTLLRSWETGVAPYDVVLTGNKAYVSNLGGRSPRPGDLTAPAGKGTTVIVDPARYIAAAGTVTVINLADGRVSSEMPAGLHSSALALSPDGQYVVVANSGDDTLSVISTRTDKVVEKIWARQTPADLFGAQPNALTFSPDGKRLYVCNGTQNAVAAVRFAPEQNASQVEGLIPVGWFPGAIQFDARRKSLYVANIKGIGAAKIFQPDEQTKLNTKDFFGTLSLLPAPSARQLSALTKTALQNMRYPKLAEALRLARPGQPPRPVPERTGEPSQFKHVIYVIKENRSYDQILGDVKAGNGNAALCTFGEAYTPNQHKLVREFALLDNTFCSGVQSADGHQWTDSAIANEYVERQLGPGFPRSYPGAKTEDGVDALAWSSSGFLWNDALDHGKTFRNYGEWMLSEAGWQDPAHKGKPVWRDFWNDFQTGGRATQLRCRPGLQSLAPYSSTNTMGWDLRVPDVVRAAEFIGDLRRFETNGDLPALTLLFLPNDHTGGVRSESPTPGAQVADNDLALGRVVEALTHSRFWPDTCLFAIEDDPQAGWDHVSAYRTTCYVVSPYTRRKQTVSTQYNQCSLVRTIELILGLPPMNQMDATAVPMSDCFTATPNLTAYSSVPNRVPLDQINPDPKQISDRGLRQDAVVSNRLPLDLPDRCPEDLLNRILWHAMKGSAAPYPDWAVKSVADED